MKISKPILGAVMILALSSSVMSGEAIAAPNLSSVIPKQSILERAKNYLSGTKAQWERCWGNQVERYTESIFGHKWDKSTVIKVCSNEEICVTPVGDIKTSSGKPECVKPDFIEATKECADFDVKKVTVGLFGNAISWDQKCMNDTPFCVLGECVKDLPEYCADSDAGVFLQDGTFLKRGVVEQALYKGSVKQHNPKGDENTKLDECKGDVTVNGAVKSMIHELYCEGTKREFKSIDCSSIKAGAKCVDDRTLGAKCDIDPATLPDADGDGRPDMFDNCKTKPNPDQKDADNDGVGDACDNCPAKSNADQLDSDGDLKGDACDNCPNVANFDQFDANSNGVGDACDEVGLEPVVATFDKRFDFMGAFDFVSDIRQLMDGSFIVSAAYEEVPGPDKFSPSIFFRLDTDGNVVWKKILPAKKNGYVHEIEDGGFVVAIARPKNSGYVNNLVMRFSQAGSMLWSTGLTLWADGEFSASAPLITDVIQAKNGDILVLCHRAILKLDPNTGKVLAQRYLKENIYLYEIVEGQDNQFVAGGVIDGFVTLVKFTADLNVEWSKKYKGSIKEGRFGGMAVFPDGGLVIGGSVLTENDAAQPVPVHRPWLFKVNSLGAIEWQRKMWDDGVGGAVGSVIVTSTGDLVVISRGSTVSRIVRLDPSGVSEKWIKYDKNIQTRNILAPTFDDGFVLLSKIIGDIGIIKFDPQGNGLAQCLNGTVLASGAHEDTFASVVGYNQQEYQGAGEFTQNFAIESLQGNLTPVDLCEGF